MPTSRVSWLIPRCLTCRSHRDLRAARPYPRPTFGATVDSRALTLRGLAAEPLEVSLTERRTLDQFAEVSSRVYV